MMVWTTDIPKVSGYYWMRYVICERFGAKAYRVTPVEVEVGARTTHVFLPGTDEDLVIHNNAPVRQDWEWYGPLEVPEGVLVEDQDAYEAICSRCKKQLHLMGTGGCHVALPP